MKRTKILAIAFSLALSTGYSQQKPYNANDITTWRFENSKGELESFSQLPKYQQEILLANYSDYKKLDRESLSKLKFNSQPVIVYFYSKHCGACRRVTPQIEKLKKENITNVIMVDENNVFFKNKVKYVPTVWYINSKGEYKQEIGREEEIIKKNDLFINNEL